MKKPTLVLVKNCGMDCSVLPDGIDIGTQLMPANQPASRGLNRKNALSSDAPLLAQPLPDHSLSDADTVGKFGLGDSVGLQVRGQLHGPILATLVHEVNSKLLDSRGRGKHGSSMPTKTRPKPGEGIDKKVMLAEGAALKALWKARAHRTQESFAEEMGFTQGNFSHFIGGRRPIYLELGIAIAKELDCALADFSPRLASEELEARQVPIIWPFSNLSYSRLCSLSPGQRLQVEGAMLEEIERIEAAAKQRRKSG